MFELEADGLFVQLHLLRVHPVSAHPAAVASGGLSGGTTVNYATEKARVNAPDGVDPASLVALVEVAGYTAQLPRPASESDTGGAAGAVEPAAHRRARRHEGRG